MKSLLFFFIMLIQSIAFSQQDTTIYSIVDKEAEFTGGAAAMMAWLMKDMNFENDLPPSKTYFILTIESDGRLSAIENIRGLQLTPQAIQKLISTSPKWTPATLNGKYVRSNYNLPLSCLYPE
jgi:hypothetical protein